MILETRSKFSGNGRVGKKIIQSGQRVNKEWIYGGERVAAEYNLAGAGLKKQSRADL